MIPITIIVLFIGPLHIVPAILVLARRQELPVHPANTRAAFVILFSLAGIPGLLPITPLIISIPCIMCLVLAAIASAQMWYWLWRESRWRETDRQPRPPGRAAIPRPPALPAVPAKAQASAQAKLSTEVEQFNAMVGECLRHKDG